MGADSDDEALSWAGETDPTHVRAPKPGDTDPKRSADGTTAGAAATDATDDAQSSLNPVMLVVFGILAGIYLLYATGWVLVGLTGRVPVQGAFFGIMYQVGEALAVASPFFWAGAVWLRVKRPAWRMLWLLIGVLVLAPWPFIFGGMG